MYCLCLLVLFIFIQLYIRLYWNACSHFAICRVKAKLEPFSKLKWPLLSRLAVQVSSIMVLLLLFHWCVVCFGEISLFTPRWCWHVWAQHDLCSQAAEKWKHIILLLLFLMLPAPSKSNATLTACKCFGTATCAKPYVARLELIEGQRKKKRELVPSEGKGAISGDVAYFKNGLSKSCSNLGYAMSAKSIWCVLWGEGGPWHCRWCL